MAHGEYTRQQFTSYGGLTICENWNTYGDRALLASVEHFNGAKSTVSVYDPTTDRARHYSLRDKVRALAIVERHLAREGYKNCVEFHRLDGTIETY